jgi:hypothetical protein
MELLVLDNTPCKSCGLLGRILSNLDFSTLNKWYNSDYVPVDNEFGNVVDNEFGNVMERILLMLV